MGDTQFIKKKANSGHSCLWGRWEVSEKNLQNAVPKSYSLSQLLSSAECLERSNGMSIKESSKWSQKACKLSTPAKAKWFTRTIVDTHNTANQRLTHSKFLTDLFWVNGEENSGADDRLSMGKPDIFCGREPAGHFKIITLSDGWWAKGGSCLVEYAWRNKETVLRGNTATKRHGTSGFWVAVFRVLFLFSPSVKHW